MTINRTEYMANSKELHHDFFAQFVTTATTHFVKHQIGMRKLRASKCEHLNDVCKWENGGRNWLWDNSPMDEKLAIELGESVTRSTRTCVGKAAARILLENDK